MRLSRTASLADDADVGRLRTLGASYGRKLDPLALFEGAIAVSDHCRVVHEHILAAAVDRDEAEALFSEPFDGACCHCPACSVRADLSAQCPIRSGELLVIYWFLSNWWITCYLPTSP